MTFMEVCGTHTMAIYQHGIRALLPANIRLISGPGCPVCVTPIDYVDHAVALARRPGTIVATFGDMVRVPGSTSSLQREKAQGADVRIVYSPLDAVALAQKHPQSGSGFPRRRLRDHHADHRRRDPRGAAPGSDQLLGPDRPQDDPRADGDPRRRPRAAGRRLPLPGPRLGDYRRRRLYAPWPAITTSPASSPASNPSMCCRG